MLTIYKASAGSGKTFQLAYQYIRLVISYQDPETGQRKLRLPSSSGKARSAAAHKHPGHRSILAITFTNKATDEMKRRIIHELALMAGREPGWDSDKERNSEYWRKLREEFNATDEQIRAAAELALDNLLYDFGSFQVSTIDSFFQTVLRSFARELDLTGNYDIVLNNEEVLNYAVDDMFCDISKGRGVAGDSDNSLLIKSITTMMNRRLEYGEQFDLLNRESGPYSELIAFFGYITNETYQLNQERMEEYLADPERIIRFSRAVQERGRDSWHSMKRRCMDALLAVADDTSVLGTNVEGILIRGAAGERDTGVTLHGVLEGKKKMFRKEVPDVVRTAVTTALEAAMDYKFIGSYMRSLGDNMYMLVLLGRMLEHIKRFRRENAAIMLSDTNELIARIIGEDDTPFIYERIGQRLRNFLLDEFQDTSRMQWRNLLPLVNESMAYNEDSLVIGDVKQCIYRFRNSDPTLLAGLKSSLPDELATETRQSPETNTNWRSNANIVSLNNAFFENLSVIMPAIRTAYNGVAQEIPPGKLKEPKGYVKFMAFGKAGMHPALETEDEEEIIGPDPFDYFSGENLLIVREIERQLRQGYPPSQIAVLCRSNPQANSFSLAVQKFTSQALPDSPWHGVTVASDEALTLDNSDAVKLVVSILRFVSAAPYQADVKSEQKAAELADLFYSYRKTLAEGNSSTVEALEQALANRDASARRVEEIKRATEASTAEAKRREEGERRIDALRALPLNPECVTLQSLINRVVREFVPAQALEGEAVYLQAFEDAVAHYVSTHAGSNDLRRFLSWWDDKGHEEKVAVGRDSNALIVMTIHKAKGLEFECVHIPWKRFSPPGKHYFWDDVSDFPFVNPADIPPLVPVTESGTVAEMPAPFSTTYIRRKQEAIVDETNVLYVAMTRAVTELCVYFRPETDKSKKEYAPDSLLMPVESGLPRTVERMCGLDYAGMPSRLGLRQGEDDFTWEAGEPVDYQGRKSSKPMALDPAFECDMPSAEPLRPTSPSRLKGIAVVDRQALLEL